MERNGLIAQIWGGDLSESNDVQLSPLAGLLGSLMDVPVITLASSAEMARPIAVMEETEVMEGVSLGDALSEELSIEVPFGALVLIQPEAFTKTHDISSKKLGEYLGQIILDMTQGVHSIDATKVDAAEEFMHLAMGGQMVPPIKLSGMGASRLQ